MTSSSSNTYTQDEPVVEGQEICIFMDGSYNDSMSSLESFMSFMDDSEEDHAPQRLGQPVKKRTKPRRMIQQTTSTSIHTSSNAPASPPTRTQSNPERKNSGLPFSSPSRWASVSPGGVRGGATRSTRARSRTRRLSPTRAGYGRQQRCPVIVVGGSKAGLGSGAEGGLDKGSGHSMNLLELQQGADRWSADASTTTHSPHNNSSFGTASFSNGRWQDSYATCAGGGLSFGGGGGGGGESVATGHASADLSSNVSRWSASLTSSQMEQISTKPRFPRRKRSGNDINSMLNANKPTATTVTTKTPNAGHEVWNNSCAAMTATTFPSTCLGDNNTIQDFTECSYSFDHTNHGDCSSQLLPSTTTQPETTEPSPQQTPATAASTSPKPSSAAPATISRAAATTTKKPRPQLPHRQKSFGRGITSIGMGARVLMQQQQQQRRESFIKQKSEPNMNVIPPQRTPSDLSLSYSSHSCTLLDLSSSNNDSSYSNLTRSCSKLSKQQQDQQPQVPNNVRRSSFQRQRSLPQSLLKVATTRARTTGTTTITKQHNDTAAIPGTGKLAALRKQKSLSSLVAVKAATAATMSMSMSMDIEPNLPERQSSQNSSATMTLLTNSSNHQDDNSTTCTEDNAEAQARRQRMFSKQRSLSSLPLMEDSHHHRRQQQDRAPTAQTTAVGGQQQQRRDSPQLPQRLPSESSHTRNDHRDLSASLLSFVNDASTTTSTDDGAAAKATTTGDGDLLLPEAPPSMPRRRVSTGSLSGTSCCCCDDENNDNEESSATTTTNNQALALSASLQPQQEEEENRCGGRMISSTTTRRRSLSEPRHTGSSNTATAALPLLSLKNLVMYHHRYRTTAAAAAAAACGQQQGYEWQEMDAVQDEDEERPNKKRQTMFLSMMMMMERPSSSVVVEADHGSSSRGNFGLLPEELDTTTTTSSTAVLTAGGACQNHLLPTLTNRNCLDWKNRSLPELSSSSSSPNATTALVL